ncbi:uncharacterized protein LOC124504184 isoform X2 [Lynx rufus]|uniref:uncharacterized protein LOC124504184 isoform X2 n=1 Tax=Lynx rufus TaxID=61384 RepID=UPI001F1280D8|nr:uncharacterized protein LOC124504184 isoform X2 [Lynx rufus]
MLCSFGNRSTRPWTPGHAAGLPAPTYSLGCPERSGALGLCRISLRLPTCPQCSWCGPGDLQGPAQGHELQEGQNWTKPQKPRSRSAASRRVSTADSGQRPAGARGRAYAGLKWPHKSAIVLRGVARQSVSCTSHRETLCRGIWRLVRAQRLPPAPSLALGCQGTGQLLGTPAWAASGETALGGCSGTENTRPRVHSQP